LFGDPPPPSVSRVVPVGGSLTSSIRRRRSRFAALGLGLAGSCLAVAGYLVGTASSSGPEREPAADDAVLRSSEAEPRGAAEVESEPSPDRMEELIVPIDENAEAPRESESDPVVDPPDAASSEREPVARSGKTSRRRAKKPPRRRETQTRKPGPGRTPDSMMPRE
jgi:hypothetical protein